MKTEISTPASTQTMPKMAKAKPQLARESLAGLAKILFDFRPNPSEALAKNEANIKLNSYLQAAMNAGYSFETSLLAQYILARFLDHYFSEKISHDLAQHEDIAKNFDKAFHTMKQHPEAFIEILELITLCQHLNRNFDLVPPNESTQLLALIQHARGEYDTKLSAPKPQEKKMTLAAKTKLTLMISIAVSIVILGGIIASFDIIIKKSETPIQTTLKHLSQASPGTQGKAQ